MPILQVMRERSRFVDLKDPIHGLGTSEHCSSISCGSGQRLLTWDIRSRDNINVYNIGDQVRSTAIASSGMLVAVGTENGRVIMKDLRDPKGSPWEITEFDDPVTALRFSDTDNLLGCGSKQGGVELVDVTSRGILRMSDVGSEVTSLKFSQSGHNLFVGFRGGLVIMEAVEIWKPLSRQQRLEPKCVSKCDFSRFSSRKEDSYMFN